MITSFTKPCEMTMSMEGNLTGLQPPKSTLINPHCEFENRMLDLNLMNCLITGFNGYIFHQNLVKR